MKLNLEITKAKEPKPPHTILPKVEVLDSGSKIAPYLIRGPE